MTPLVAVLAQEHFQTVELLYQNGADILDVLGFHEMTPFIAASQFGDLDMVQRLLDYKANVNAKTKYNWSALHYVSMWDPLLCCRPPQWFSDIAQLLLQHGADLEAQGKGCMTPLHVVAGNRRVEVIHVLHEHGANVDAENDKGETPSWVAVARRYNGIMKVLLEYGAKSR